jgi:hypothetical protein
MQRMQAMSRKRAAEIATHLSGARNDVWGVVARSRDSLLTLRNRLRNLGVGLEIVISGQLYIGCGGTSCRC